MFAVFLTCLFTLTTSVASSYYNTSEPNNYYEFYKFIEDLEEHNGLVIREKGSIHPKKTIFLVQRNGRGFAVTKRTEEERPASPITKEISKDHFKKLYKILKTAVEKISDHESDDDEEQEEKEEDQSHDESDEDATDDDDDDDESKKKKKKKKAEKPEGTTVVKLDDKANEKKDDKDKNDDKKGKDDDSAQEADGGGDGGGSVCFMPCGANFGGGCFHAGNCGCSGCGGCMPCGGRGCLNLPCCPCCCGSGKTLEDVWMLPTLIVSKSGPPSGKL